MEQEQMREQLVRDSSYHTKEQPYVIRIKPGATQLEYIDATDHLDDKGRLADTTGFLKWMYELVGCEMIEGIHGHAYGHRVEMYCDEEFLLHDELPDFNFTASLLAEQPILGTVIVTGGLDNGGYDLPLYGTEIPNRIMDWTVEHGPAFLQKLNEHVTQEGTP